MKGFDEQGRKKSILKSITPGERLRLRDDALGHVQPRQWIFKRIESNETILLMDESGGFGWSVPFPLEKIGLKIHFCTREFFRTGESPYCFSGRSEICVRSISF